MPKVTPKYNQESFDKMLRRFKNQCERAGIVKRVRELEYYEKPNFKRNEKNQALKRTKKNNAFKAERMEMRRKQTKRSR
jgi:small subunit ribosomal protein S21